MDEALLMTCSRDLEGQPLICGRGGMAYPVGSELTESNLMTVQVCPTVNALVVEFGIHARLRTS